MEIQSREKEIKTQSNILKAELKSSEQERYRVSKELGERKNKVQNLQIKYKALIQSKQGDVDVYKHSQAYYVIKAAQEKEELERKEDELKAQILKSEKELKALYNTLTHLKNRNKKLRDYNINKGSTQKDFKLKEALEQQYQSAGQSFLYKKVELDKLNKIIGNYFNLKVKMKIFLLKKIKKCKFVIKN